MGIIEKIKTKLSPHHGEDKPRVRLLETENNKQQFGVPTEDTPRNRMMDTVSNEQGAQYALEQKLGRDIDTSGENKNVMTHTLSNEQAEELAGGITRDDEPPRNKLLDVQPNDGIVDNNVAQTKLNSSRVL